MIKQDLNITIDNTTFSGVINVPSAVMTSTPQEEELNLAYSPNFDILAYDMNGLIEGNENREISFTLGDYDYTAYVKPAQKFQTGYVLLDYVDSMTQATHSEPEPEPEPEPVDPLDSILTIAGPLTPENYGDYLQVVYSRELGDVYLRSVGLGYAEISDSYYIPTSANPVKLCFGAPSTYRFETITFINMNTTYKSTLLSAGTFENGTISVDASGNTVWTRNVDYDPTVDSTITMDFTQMIQTVGQEMTFDSIVITLSEYNNQPL